MQPVTHALTSLALARVGQRRLPRFGTAMLVVAGFAPDLDYASYFGGASSFLRYNRTLLHSLLSSFVLAIALAAAFYFVALHREKKASGLEDLAAPKLPFGAAFLVCAIGIAAHSLLDVVSGVGVRLLWPFRVRWFAFDLLRDFDIWILMFLLAGLLLPMLIGLVSEEIGERKKRTSGRGSAIAALVLILAYVGVRGILHSRAVDLLESHDYHGRVALAVGAFPESTSPLEWRGVVSTDNTIEEIGVPFGVGREFDPEHSATQYKPDDSPMLETGEQTAVAQRFLQYARFPIASVVRIGNGYEFELRDARFDEDDASAWNILVRVRIGEDMRILEQGFLFASRR
ncbi:MAG: metal-dependent hydrolase [Candidatus Acidiferrales bacterium]